MALANYIYYENTLLLAHMKPYGSNMTPWNDDIRRYIYYCAFSLCNFVDADLSYLYADNAWLRIVF